MIILNKKRLIILAVFVALIAVVDLFIITTKSSYSANSGGTEVISGGSAGCAGYQLSTCTGASWVYYSHNFTSNSDYVYVPYFASFAPNASIGGCSGATGYYRYGWIDNFSSYGDNGGGQRGVATVGSNGGRIHRDYVSIYYGGGMNFPQGWSYWLSVLSKFEAAKAQGFASNNAVKTWDANSALSWFCYADTRTLTGISVDMNGNKLGNDPGSVTVSNGKSASISAKSISGYEFKGWRSSQSSGAPSGSSTYTVSSLTSNVTVYAVYDITYYEGYSKVDATVNNANYNNSTGWVTKDVTVQKYIPCSNSCYVSYTHGVRKKSGGLNGSYTFNGQNGTITASAPNENRITSNVSNISVGSQVCQTLNFQKQSNSSARVNTTACVIAPYNFNAAPEVDKNNSDIVYAGEIATKSVNARIDKRYNDIPRIEYATDAPNAQYQIVSYYGNNLGGKAGGITSNSNICAWFGNSNCGVAEFKTNETLSSGDNTKSISLQIPDESAGTDFCIALAVYPATSGIDNQLDSNWSKTPEANKWAISDSKCYKVAKKPSFQIWGGNLYSNGAIKTSRNDKINTVGKIFGSWGELGVIAKNTVTNFASGAALSGGVSTDKNSDVGCKLGPLTIANRDCDYGKSGVGVSNSVKESLISQFIPNQDKNIGVEDGILQYSEEQKYYYRNGTITISNNIENIKKRIGSLADVPQVIIYAKGGDVNIDCKVTQIDAIIIADGTVNTCANPDPETGEAKNAANRSNQLVINGSIIAQQLVLGRTYGAATGENTAIPAEIINALPIIYYWVDASNEDNNNDDESKTNATFYSSYQREIAPRL